MNRNELMHYGVLGMRWGVRRSDAQLAKGGGSSKKKKTDGAHDDYKKAHNKQSVKTMSDAELKARNNRLQMEKQYRDLTKKTGRGKKFVNTFVSVAGTTTAVAGAYQTYKAFANKGLDKIGKYVLDGINLEGPFDG